MIGDFIFMDILKIKSQIKSPYFNMILKISKSSQNYLKSDFVKSSIKSFNTLFTQSRSVTFIVGRRSELGGGGLTISGKIVVPPKDIHLTQVERQSIEQTTARNLGTRREEKEPLSCTYTMLRSLMGLPKILYCLLEDAAFRKISYQVENGPKSAKNL
jgi:hypothetical protein